MPDPGLSGLTVLVTRPAHQAMGLCQAIEQAGGRAISLPVIEIAGPEDEAAARVELARLAEFDIVIFISANAVHRCYLYIGEVLPAGPQWAAVGQATARQLQAEFRHQADLLPDAGYNSEALLAMPALQQVAGQEILIIRGEGGRTVLAETLAERGARVSYANLYRRIVPAGATTQLAEVIRDNKIDVVVLTSGEGIDNLLTIAGETYRNGLCKMSWLVIHPRLAELAGDAGCENEIIISEGPADEDIVQCLLQWHRQQTQL